MSKRPVTAEMLAEHHEINTVRAVLLEIRPSDDFARLRALRHARKLLPGTPTERIDELIEDFT